MIIRLHVQQHESMVMYANLHDLNIGVNGEENGDSPLLDVQKRNRPAFFNSA